jgi:pyrroloquinoline-quinone synthase
MTRLDEIVLRYDLNDHPFYRAWRAGTLPASALAAYADDYAPFIRSIETGWRTLGETEHADMERSHAGLWDQFRTALGGGERPVLGKSVSREAQSLVACAERDFADADSAIGALYAFEAQQPKTASSKLNGLREHYGNLALGEDGIAYFRVHADDYGEREKLAARARRLDAASFRHAVAACEALCRAMWSTLDAAMPG